MLLRIDEHSYELTPDTLTDILGQGVAQLEKVYNTLDTTKRVFAKSAARMVLSSLEDVVRKNSMDATMAANLLRPSKGSDPVMFLVLLIGNELLSRCQDIALTAQTDGQTHITQLGFEIREPA